MFTYSFILLGSPGSRWLQGSTKVMRSEAQDWWKWSGPSMCLKDFSPLLQPKTEKAPMGGRPGREDNPPGNQVWIDQHLQRPSEYRDGQPESYVRFIFHHYSITHCPSSFLFSKAGGSSLLRSVLRSPSSSVSSVFTVSVLLAPTHAQVSYPMPLSSSWFLSTS